MRKVLLAGFFLGALFVYFKNTTAPSRWVVWSFKNISKAFQIDAGREVIRPEALAMSKIASTRSDKFYRLFGELKTSQYISYPAREYLYPIRISEEASLVFVKQGESPLAGCKLLKREGEVNLYECAQSN
ncbi:MAG: hypothetical protein EBQ92_07195 [Proteobacteria bacterium]|nr:hypothetical protein [Pseudomonadota bacterium]